MSVKSHDSNQSRLSIKNDLSQNFTARQHRLTRRAIANSFSKSANYIKILIKTMDRASYTNHRAHEYKWFSIEYLTIS